MRRKSTEKPKLLWGTHRRPPGEVEFKWRINQVMGREFQEMDTAHAKVLKIHLCISKASTHSRYSINAYGINFKFLLHSENLS